MRGHEVPKQEETYVPVLPSVQRKPQIARGAKSLFAACALAVALVAAQGASDTIENAQSEAVVTNFMGGFYFQSIDQDPASLNLSIPQTGIGFVDAAFSSALSTVEDGLDGAAITRDQDVSVEFSKKNIIFRDASSKIIPLSLQCSTSNNGHQVTCDPDLPYRKLLVNLGDGDDQFTMRFDDKKRILPATSVFLGDGTNTASVVTKKNIILDVTGGNGSDTVDLGAADNWRYTPQASLGAGDDFGNCFDSKCDISGQEGNDIIIGTSRNDTLAGGAGNDIIEGHAGWDTIAGDAGDDTISGGDDRDKIDTGAGKNQAFGGQGTDRVIGGTGDDLLRGGDGWDHLYGSAGNDNIFGDDGNDYIEGNDGNDNVYGGNDWQPSRDGLDTLRGGNGNDRLWSEDSNWALINDSSNCGPGDDVLYSDKNDGKDNCEHLESS